MGATFVALLIDETTAAGPSEERDRSHPELPCCVRQRRSTPERGDPKRRLREKVREDLKNELITADEALRVYGLEKALSVRAKKDAARL